MYYEAFVQLEIENHILKMKVQELCENLKKYEERLTSDDPQTLTTKPDEVIKVYFRLLLI
jgi:hypothetical protein